MRLLRENCTAVDEAAAEGSWVLLEKINSLPKMLQRELLAASQGGDNRGIDGDGSTDRGKKDNDERESNDEQGRRGGGRNKGW